MSDKRFAIPLEVHRRALLQGGTGRDWVESLDRTVEGLEQAWMFSAGSVLHGGSAGLVIAVTTADNRDAVLKIPAPWVDAGRGALPVLLLADGQGYVSVFRYNRESGTMLLERLDAPLSSLGLSTTQQIEAICATLRVAWLQPADPAPFLQGDQKALELADFIQKTWSSLGEPCSKRVVDKAIQFTELRRLAFDPVHSVLAHGDAHADNILMVKAGQTPSQFKFVDPEGIFIEPAYDLGVLMREWSAELLEGDPLDLGRHRCNLLANLSGVDAESIWQWGYIERVSTGLHLLELGWSAESKQFLSVAEAWALA